MTVPDAAFDRDLVDVLVADHREFDQLFAELASGSGTPEHRRRLCDVLIAELVRHSVAEEEYLYPTVRELLPSGEVLADAELARHAEAEQLMKRLESVPVTDKQFDRLTTELILRMRQHMRDEERDIFPLLRRVVTPAQLQRLAGMADMAKRSAPTRPHPTAPHRPPWNMMLAPGAGLVDRIRDAVSGRTTKRDKA